MFLFATSWIRFYTMFSTFFALNKGEKRNKPGNKGKKKETRTFGEYSKTSGKLRVFSNFLECYSVFLFFLFSCLETVFVPVSFPCSTFFVSACPLLFPFFQLLPSTSLACFGMLICVFSPFYLICLKVFFFHSHHFCIVVCIAFFP